MTVRRFVVFQLTEGLCVHVVLEVEDLLLGTLPVSAPLLLLFLLLLFLLLLLLLDFFLFLVLGGFHLELQRVVVDETDLPDGQMLGVPGDQGDAGQLGGDPVVVEEPPVRARRRVAEVEDLAVGGFPLVPVPLAVLDPPRRHRGGVDEPPYLVRGEAAGEPVVDPGDPALFLHAVLSRRGLRVEADDRRQEQPRTVPEHRSGRRIQTG